MRRQCRVWAPASPRTVWWRYLRRLAWPLGTLAMPCLGGTWGQAWWETGCSSPTYSWWSPSSWCLPAGQPTPQGGICAQPWLPSPSSSCSANMHALLFLNGSCLLFLMLIITLPPLCAGWINGLNFFGKVFFVNTAIGLMFPFFLGLSNVLLSFECFCPLTLSAQDKIDNFPGLRCDQRWRGAAKHRLSG